MHRGLEKALTLPWTGCAAGHAHALSGGAPAPLRPRRRRGGLRLIRPEPAAVIARFLLERDEEIAVSDVRLNRHGLGGAATDELGVDHPVGDEDVGQEPSFAIPFLGVELQPYLLAGDELSVHVGDVASALARGLRGL